MDFSSVFDRISKNEYTREELVLIFEKYFSKYSTCPNNFKNLVQLNNVKMKSNNCIDILKHVYNTYPKRNNLKFPSIIIPRTTISNNIRSDIHSTNNIRSDIPSTNNIQSDIPSINIEKTHPSILEKIWNFFKKKKFTKEKRECVVCLDSPLEIVFIPCGHICTCISCSKLINVCPLCRSKLTQKFKFFF